ncbi:hypothetical protein AAEX28_15275 [Lentisphaerota bacterium WC36G]|nr:hypothetical protein LJT99_02045 [Lentisphaerae bacterium WC36]
MSNKNERGAALIITLCMLAVVMLLAGSAVAISQYAERDSYTYADLSRSLYHAESAANRVYWLILNDRKKYPNRNIDFYDENIEQENGERYFADGKRRIFKKYGGEFDIKYKILDAVNGLNISGNSPHRDILMQNTSSNEDSHHHQILEQLAYKMQDYVDPDNIVRLNSLEKNEYIQAGLINLPRNSYLQYREELLLIPGNSAICIPDDSGRIGSIRLIAPKGLAAIIGRPNLYSTSLNQIAERCNLNSQEIGTLSSAMKKWQQNGTSLNDTLPKGFLQRLEMYYGTNESSFYTILIDTSASERPGIRLAVTFQLQFKNNPKIYFYEFMYY